MKSKGRTVVLCADSQAKAAGVECGQNISRAMRICPTALVVSADMETYLVESRAFLDALAQFSPAVEPDGLGAAWLDASGCEAIFGEPRRLAAKIFFEISDKLGMTCRIGLAANKMTAKLALMSGKLIAKAPPEESAEHISELPIQALDGVDEKITRQLLDVGITKAGQLADMPRDALIRRFGAVGQVIWERAQGIDNSKVKRAWPPQIITLEHISDNVMREPCEVEQLFQIVASKCACELRKSQLAASKILIRLFDSHSKRCIAGVAKLKQPTCSEYSIFQTLCKFARVNMRAGMEIWKVSVGLDGLEQSEGAQLCLFGDKEKRIRVERVVRIIQERFGMRAIYIAADALH